MTGPLLLACNHPNSFLDGIILDILFDEPIWALTRGDVFKGQDWGVVTAKEKTWYAHIIRTPKQAGYILFPEMKQKVLKCFLYNGKTPLKFKQQPEGVFVYLDGVQLDAIDTIIELQLQ